MGAFFFIHGDGDPSPLAARCAASFGEQGFGRPKSIRKGRWFVSHYEPLVSATGGEHTDGDGDSILCAGTLFYGGSARKEALSRLLADFKNGRVDEGAMYGSFAVVLAVGNTASVLTDRTGTLHVYMARCGEATVLSTSFLALAAALPSRRVDDRAVYDYVFAGAPLGGATVFQEIRLLSDRSTLVFNDGVEAVQRPRIEPERREYRSLEEAAAHCSGILRERFRRVREFWPRVDTALSGGYDSRLVLALARDAGIKPHVHVYGKSSDPDVRCAQAIAAAEGFELDHGDKSATPLPEPDRFAEVVERNYLAFDGYPTDGIFDNGMDLATRSKRAAGTLMLNGGGGEVFRDFFYLANRSFDARDLAWTFYAQFDPRVCTSRFDERQYLDGIGGQIEARLESGSRRLARREVEAAYPLYRCSYWMGRNNSVNSRLGAAWTPFIDPAVISAALAVPMTFKYCGQLEGRMISIIDPSLARHPSVYGRSFDTAPGTKERLKAWVGRARPPLLRRYAYRLRSHGASPWKGALDHARIGKVIDAGFPAMKNYFEVSRVTDAIHARRICTLEHLFARTGASIE